MSILTPIEQDLRNWWHQIDGEARDALQATLAGVKADLAKVGPLLQTFEVDLKGAVEAAEPAVQQAVAQLILKLLEDAGGLLGTDLAGKPDDQPQPPAAA